LVRAAAMRFAIKSCVCDPVGFPDADVNADENKPSATLRPLDYWRLWLLDTVLVSAGFLFFLATHYGTYDFFGRACGMALLPLIPVLVLVGGGGSTVFALTRVLIEKRSLKFFASLVLLVGPALVLTALLAGLGVWKSPAHRLAYVCLGNAPASASRVQIAGYSTFPRAEWLAVFRVEPKDFQTMVARSKLERTYSFDFRNALGRSSLKGTRLYQSLPSLGEAPCFARVFNEGKEHQRGGVYAMFDPATATAVVFREYGD
jgi:hypothetical protein